MNDKKTEEVLEELKKLSAYSFRLLTENTTHPNKIRSMRNQYLYRQFILSLSFIDGIKTLAEKGGQLWCIIPLVRSAWEAYINSRFVCLGGRSHIWLYNEILSDDKRRTHTTEAIYAKKQISNEKYRKRVAEANRIDKLLKRRYGGLPTIPNVINKDKDLGKCLTIRDKCLIIDHYSRPSKGGNPKTSNIDYYDIVYGYLSFVPHASPTTLYNLFDEDLEGNLHIDVTGGNDKRTLGVLLHMAYMYHYELMRVVLNRVITPKRHLDGDIKTARRRMASMKFDG